MKCIAIIITSDPAPWRLMLSLEHGKQNLWWGTDGHWTKCVSSNLSWQSVHLRVVLVGAAVPDPGDVLVPLEAGFGAGPAGLPGPWATDSGVPFGVPGPSPTPCGASLEVTVVELTCRLPDDRRPLVDPAQHKENRSVNNDWKKGSHWRRTNVFFCHLRACVREIHLNVHGQSLCCIHSYLSSQTTVQLLKICNES